MAHQRGREQALQAVVPDLLEPELAWSDGPCTAYRARQVTSGRLLSVVVTELTRLPGEAAEAFRADLDALVHLRGHPHVVCPEQVELEGDRAIVVSALLPPWWSPRAGTGARVPGAATVAGAGPVTSAGATPVMGAGRAPVMDGGAAVVGAGARLAGALAAAHARGLLHRDLRLDSIVATPDGRPAIAGFAVAGTRGTGPVAAALARRAPWHLAPETFESGHTGPPADVYALGSLLYELLAGKPPFTAFEDETRAALIVHVLRDPAPQLSGSAYPRPLGELLASVLSKDARDRPTAGVLAVELERVLPLLRPGAPEGTEVTADRGDEVDGEAGAGVSTPRVPPVWPGVVAPAGSRRAVVVPPSTGRGQPSQPLDRPEGSLPPLVGPGAVAGPGTDPSRPVYVDPAVVEAAEGGERVGPFRRSAPRRQTPGAAGGSPGDQPTEGVFDAVAHPGLLPLVAVVLAVVVLAVALLLALGVI